MERGKKVVIELLFILLCAHKRALPLIPNAINSFGKFPHTLSNTVSILLNLLLFQPAQYAPRDKNNSQMDS